MATSSSPKEEKVDPAYHKVLIDLISKKYGVNLNDPAAVTKAIAAMSGDVATKNDVVDKIQSAMNSQRM